MCDWIVFLHQGKLKGSIQIVTSRVKVSTSHVLIRAKISNIACTKEDNKMETKNKKHLVTYLLNKCNIGVNL